MSFVRGREEGEEMFGSETNAKHGRRLTLRCLMGVGPGDPDSRRGCGAAAPGFIGLLGTPLR